MHVSYWSGQSFLHFIQPHYGNGDQHRNLHGPYMAFQALIFGRRTNSSGPKEKPNCPPPNSIAITGPL
ncbi:hypothetical protein VNO77_37663 [Canavalia gladiata]|uniref:Uncharacterized protein n=1 Tax=Canavalia gladiata TaxID=3824 RepID=A0AAN9KAH9_CANGL